MAANEKIKKLVTKLKSQTLKLQVLNDLEEIKNSTTDTTALLKDILSLTAKTIKIEKGFIVLYDKKSPDPLNISISNNGEMFEDRTLLRDVCSNIIRTNKPVIINDTRLHKRLRRCKIKNIIALPLIFNKEINGIFLILNKRRSLFKKRDLIIFSLICRFTANSIEHFKMFSTLEEKNRELEAIYSIDRIRDTIKDFETMMDAILQELNRLIDSKMSFFLRFIKDKNETDLKVSGKLKSSAFVNNNSSMIYEMSRATLNKGELMIFNNLNKDIISAMCTPVVIDDNTLGVFGVINSTKQEGFANIDRSILNAVARQTDSAIFEDLAKSQIKELFGRYVSSDVLETILNAPEKDYMKIMKRDVTVLFSDLRGFTTLSERLDPEEMVSLLNEHFEAMTTVILKNNGTLDKFMGDETMAVFGAPIYSEAHALKAIKTALEMQKAHALLNKKWGRKGIHIPLGVGINTGDVVVGNIGSSQRSDYTVIGDDVNIAARLCDAAKANQILITEQTYQEVKKSVKVQKLNPIIVKGKSRPILVYNVVGLVK